MRHTHEFLVGTSVTVILAVGLLSVYLVARQHAADQMGPRLSLLGPDRQWGYMPGVTPEADGLQVAYRGFKIVEQDGSGGQPNPPVNEYGTHLDVPSSFAVSATLKDVRGSAALELYGKVPEVSDEFRVEEPSIRLTLSGNHLDAEVWDGNATQDLAAQQPVEQQTFTVHPQSSETMLELSDQSGQLTLRADNEQLGQLPDDHIFASHAVWFGADAETAGGGFVINQLTARAIGGGDIRAVDTSAEPPVSKNPQGLQELASKKRPGFLIGSDAALWAATSNTGYNKLLFGGNFGIVTPENALKWQFVEPQPGVYDFHEADALVNDALKNHLQVHGHTLVFSEALPAWVQDLPTNTPAQKAYVQQVMVNHITTLVDHFKGRINEWDVVNEPIKDYDSNGNFDTAEPLRENVFYRAMGANYINIAFAAAHQADPSAKLGINDWGFDGLQNGSGDDRANTLYTLLKSLKSEGVPLNYFGFEAHIYDASTDAIVNSRGQAPILTQHINELAALGIQSRISEMDVTGDNGEAWRAKQFSGVLQACLNNPHCMAFSMWSMGMTDMSQGDDQYPYALQTGEVDSPFNQQNEPVQPTYVDLQDLLRR